MHVYLRSSLLRKSFVIFMFISLKFLVSKSSNCDLVIFNHIASLVLNLFCSESKTWLNDASPSQFTWIVLLYASCGAHEQGEISGLMEQWSEATCTIETNVYTNDPIFKYYLGDIQISNQYPFYRLKIMHAALFFLVFVEIVYNCLSFGIESYSHCYVELNIFSRNYAFWYNQNNFKDHQRRAPHLIIVSNEWKQHQWISIVVSNVCEQCAHNSIDRSVGRTVVLLAKI